MELAFVILHFPRLLKFFADNEKISTEDKLSQVSLSKFDDGYIISFIINKIYIFNVIGNLNIVKYYSIVILLMIYILHYYLIK